MGEPGHAVSGATEPPTKSIVTAVAERGCVEPTDLTPPLDTIIDTNALEVLFTGRDDEFVHREFTYKGSQTKLEGAERPRMAIE